MVRVVLVLLALAALVAIPFALKPRQSLLADADDTLVVITPHNEAIRYEFSRAFADYYRETTGRTVRMDWRMPGGTSEIARYLQGEFFAAFAAFWRGQGRAWTPEVQVAFDNPRIELPVHAAEDTPAQAARRAFLNSGVGMGVDVFFGGGAFDFDIQARAGRLVDAGVGERHPEWLGAIPQAVSGEAFRDPEGRWVGAAISSFGICWNADSLEALGVNAPPAQWADLADPRFRGQVALADPTKSGSAAKAFEMILQQQMAERVRDDADEPRALAEGWIEGLRLIQKISANARYFTDSASNVPVDVSQGDAALGMCIDFYGRSQSEAVRVGSTSRLHYLTPAGGSSFGVDPIGILRGAPHRRVAEHFVDFVLSMEGQKFWNFRTGTPGGPVRHALRRLPVRRELYAPEFAAFRSDPEVFPYEEARAFAYHPEWTGSLFKTISFIIRVLCLDPHEELVAAWEALCAAGFPPEAMRRFSDLGAVDYRRAREEIRPILAGADPLGEVRLAKQLGDHFRKQYREAAELARQGK